MELDITDFYNYADAAEYAASRAELGDDAARITWRNAKDAHAEHNLLDTEEKKDAARDFLRGFGAWDEDEIAAWDDAELNALVIQFIAGDIRERDSLADSWEAYEALASDGQASGRLYECRDGRVYYYIGE